MLCYTKLAYAISQKNKKGERIMCEINPQRYRNGT